MRLRRKTMLTVAVILAVMTVVIVVISSDLVMESALGQENREVQRNLERSLGTIEAMENDLSTTVRDWATWNDSYNFVQSQNRQYIDSNLADSTFSSLKINFILFFDDLHRLVYGMGHDYEANIALDVPPDVLSGIVNSERSMDLTHVGDGASGYILVNEGILLISAHAITDSNASAPVAGSLVMARYMDTDQVQAITDTTQVQTTLLRADDPNGSGLAPDQYAGLIGSGNSLTVPVNDSEIAAYGTIDGLNGTPAVLVRIQDQRAAVSQASSSITLLIATLVLVSLAFCAITLVVTDRYTMKRVETLSDQIGKMGLKGGVGQRLRMPGSDELSDLADEMNKALDAIETMELELRESERRYKAIVDDQTEMIFRILENGTFTFVNDAMVKELHRQPNEILGRNLMDLLVPALYEAIIDQCKEAKAAGTVVTRDYHYYHRVEGKDKWYSWSVRGIHDRSGRLKEYQGVGRDLTEQKEAEEALSQANRKLNLLASITRHDVMNQLTVAHGFVSLSKLRTEDPRTLDHLGKAETALQAIQGYLEFTRDYQRMGLVQPVWIDLQAVLEKAAALPRSLGIAVQVSMDDYEISTDPLVEKVFYNLIDNSVRHGGGVRYISMTCRPTENGLQLVFEDDGKGIPAENKERIFQAGYGDNTGYGLFLAREILGASGMTIVESGEPDRGARFVMMVPPERFRRASLRG